MPNQMTAARRLFDLSCLFSPLPVTDSKSGPDGPESCATTCQAEGSRLKTKNFLALFRHFLQIPSGYSRVFKTPAVTYGQHRNPEDIAHLLRSRIHCSLDERSGNHSMPSDPSIETFTGGAT
jgi:hypothetical protein